MVVNSSKCDFEVRIHAILITNCPITASNVANVYTIFGPDASGLRHRAMKKAVHKVESSYFLIPQKFLQNHKVDMVTALRFVNELTFLITLSQGIRFGV